MHRSWWERATGASLLGLPVVAIYAVIGIVPIVATIPAGDIPSRDRLLWLAVAVVAQAGLAAVALLGGWLIGTRTSGAARALRIGVVALAGAVRGLLVPVAADSLGLVDPSEVAVRVANSSLTVLLWMAALAFLIDAQAEFRRAYREAFERDIAIAARSVRGTEIEPTTWDEVDDAVREWSEPVRRRVGRLRDAPMDPQSAEIVVQQAADAIRDLVTTRLRPLSHRLWFTAAGQPPRVRWRAVAEEALSRAPILTPLVLALLVIGMIIGSVVRYGSVVAGISGSVLIAISVGYVLLSRIRWARAHARAWNAITVPLFSVGAALLSTQASAWLVDSGSDLPTIVTIALGIPTFAVIVAGASVTSGDRRALLEVMRDPDAVRDAVRRVQQREAATYLHNHVKSQLTASAMRMKEAVRTDDPQAVRDAADAALDVLSRPLPDAIMLGRQSPAERLREVTESWVGIAEVDVALPDGLPDPVILLIADVLAEAIANAVRGGGATRIDVTGQLERDSLHLVIADDGQSPVHLVTDPGSGQGLGTAWLDSLVAGQWQRERTADGTIVRVRLPLSGAAAPGDLLDAGS